MKTEDCPVCKGTGVVEHITIARIFEFECECCREAEPEQKAVKKEEDDINNLSVYEYMDKEGIQVV